MDQFMTKHQLEKINKEVNEVFKGALSQFRCFQLHSLLKSLPGTFTRSQNAQMD